MGRKQTPVLPISSRISLYRSHAVAHSLNLTGHFNPSTSSSQRAGCETKPTGLSKGAIILLIIIFLSISYTFLQVCLGKRKPTTISLLSLSETTDPVPSCTGDDACLFGKKKKWIIEFKSGHLCHIFSFNNCSERLRSCSWVPTLHTHFVNDIFTALVNE